MIKFKDKTYNSSAEIFFDIFDDRLKLMIVWLLANNSLRFKELSECLAPITNKTLTAKLRELESLGLVNRESFAEVPPRVEYELSDDGVALKPIIDEILAWSQKYAEKHAQKINEPSK